MLNTDHLTMSFFSIHNFKNRQIYFLAIFFFFRSLTWLLHFTFCCSSKNYFSPCSLFFVQFLTSYEKYFQNDRFCLMENSFNVANFHLVSCIQLERVLYVQKVVHFQIATCYMKLDNISWTNWRHRSLELFFLPYKGFTFRETQVSSRIGSYLFSLISFFGEGKKCFFRLKNF